jgi:hypothetical protein
MALLRRRAPHASPRRILPPPGVIRRDRRELARLREEKLRDLGGLMLEMYRRDVFREDLLSERCNELLGLDARLRELDGMLAAARRRVPAARCECGALLPWGSRFCPACGRSAGGQEANTCAECGRPLQADARVCSSCGAAEPEVPASGEDEGVRAEEDAGA